MAGPFQGVLVIEAASYVAGPYAAMLLGELGADVIKIESPAGGDPSRSWSHGDRSPWFAAHNAAKRSLTLDLRSAETRTVLSRLVCRADVLIQNKRPGVAERLGLGYEQLSEVNPRLVYCAVSAAGPTGGRAGQPGFDSVGQALSGLMSLISSPEDSAPIGPPLADTVAGLTAAFGISAALHARASTGRGQRVDTSLLAAGLGLVREALTLYARTGLVLDRHSRARVAQAYLFRCADGRSLVVHLSSAPKFWQAFVMAVGRGDLGADPRYLTRENRIREYDSIRQQLAPVFGSAPREEWLRRLEEADVPCAPVHDVDHVLADPEVSGVLLPLADDPVGPLLSFDGASTAPFRPVPALGEHTDEILAELGYDQAQIEQLRAKSLI